MAAKKKVAKKARKTRARPAPARRAKKVSPIPRGFHAVTAAFRVSPCAQAIRFLEQAFGAKVRDRYDGPGGVVFHAELAIGDSLIMCGDPQPGFADAFPLCAGLYVRDSDAVYARAIELGATVVRPIQDQFYGDRSGTVRDAWGNEWTVSTHKEDVSPKEMKRRMDAMT
jgi:PhnB protein